MTQAIGEVSAFLLQPFTRRPFLLPAGEMIVYFYFSPFTPSLWSQVSRATTSTLLRHLSWLFEVRMRWPFSHSHFLIFVLVLHIFGKHSKYLFMLLAFRNVWYRGNNGHIRVSVVQYCVFFRSFQSTLLCSYFNCWAPVRCSFVRQTHKP